MSERYSGTVNERLLKTLAQISAEFGNEPGNIRNLQTSSPTPLMDAHELASMELVDVHGLMVQVTGEGLDVLTAERVSIKKVTAPDGSDVPVSADGRSFTPEQVGTHTIEVATDDPDRFAKDLAAVLGPDAKHATEADVDRQAQRLVDAQLLIGRVDNASQEVAAAFLTLAASADLTALYAARWKALAKRYHEAIGMSVDQLLKTRGGVREVGAEVERLRDIERDYERGRAALPDDPPEGYTLGQAIEAMAAQRDTAITDAHGALVLIGRIAAALKHAPGSLSSVERSLRGEIADFITDREKAHR